MVTGSLIPDLLTLCAAGWGGLGTTAEALRSFPDPRGRSRAARVAVPAMRRGRAPRRRGHNSRQHRSRHSHWHCTFLRRPAVLGRHVLVWPPATARLMSNFDEVLKVQFFYTCTSQLAVINVGFLCWSFFCLHNIPWCQRSFLDSQHKGQIFNE